jgi:hypothetical protein
VLDSTNLGNGPFHFAERYLKRLLSDYVRYYHEDRTHLGLNKGTPAGRGRSTDRGGVVSRARLGGLHHRYESSCVIIEDEHTGEQIGRIARVDVRVELCRNPGVGSELPILRAHALLSRISELRPMPVSHTCSPQ